MSDLHFGEGNALLHDNSCGIVDKAVDAIEKLSRTSGDGRFNDGVEELILLGDIVDLSEAEDLDACRRAKEFFTRLLDDVDVGRIVFVPGNHDHHLWVKVLREKRPAAKKGRRPVIPDLPWTCENPAAFVDACLPPARPPTEVRYPCYALGDERRYFFFDHGHLFSPLFSKWSRVPVVRRLLRFKGRTQRARSLKELEETAFSFMEWIWHPKEGRLSDARERFYDGLARILLELKFKAARGNTFREDCQAILDDALVSQICWYLTRVCRIRWEFLYNRDFHFIFGHTHIGGRVLRADRRLRVGGPIISVWNTGGWIVPSEVFSPDAYLFYIEHTENGLTPDAYKMVRSREGIPADGYDGAVLKVRLQGVAK